MSTQHSLLASYLLKLETALQQHELCSTNSPSKQQLASLQPFCLDTLTIEQWLQFVLIPRFSKLVASGAELPVIPADNGMAGMADIAFNQRNIRANEVVDLIRSIDFLLETPWP
tara:strand:- start:871 stop:1212 length:342 start_codon:yes stop_codon:yes gene_type:complete